MVRTAIDYLDCEIVIVLGFPRHDVYEKSWQDPAGFCTRAVWHLSILQYIIYIYIASNEGELYEFSISADTQYLFVVFEGLLA